MLQLSKQLSKAHRAAGVTAQPVAMRLPVVVDAVRGAAVVPAMASTWYSGASIGDEIELDELLARRAELLGAQVQPLHERGAAVVAQALRIGHRDQEQIQRRGARVAAIDQVALHEGLVNPAELLGHLAQPLRAAAVA